MTADRTQKHVLIIGAGASGMMAACLAAEHGAKVTLIDRMQQLGVRDAFNLDGGQTAVMCFMGRAVNKSASVNRDKLRKVSSMIGFGLIEP